MRGKLWLWLGALVGIAIGLGKLPYLAGAASSLAGTAIRVVNSGGLTLIHEAARHGAPRRSVEGLTAIIAILVPGIAAVVLVLAARVTLLVRSLLGVLIAALGVASFAYYSAGHAIGVVILALAAAGILVVATGPFVAAPLAGLAALIGTVYLPKLLETQSAISRLPVQELHEALFASAGSPLWMRVLVLLVAVIPFALGARLLLR